MDILRAVEQRERRAEPVHVAQLRDDTDAAIIRTAIREDLEDEAMLDHRLRRQLRRHHRVDVTAPEGPAPPPGGQSARR